MTLDEALERVERGDLFTIAEVDELSAMEGVVNVVADSSLGELGMRVTAVHLARTAER